MVVRRTRTTMAMATMYAAPFVLPLAGPPDEPSVLLALFALLVLGPVVVRGAIPVGDAGAWPSPRVPLVPLFKPDPYLHLQC